MNTRLLAPNSEIGLAMPRRESSRVHGGDQGPNVGQFFGTQGNGCHRHLNNRVA